MKKRHLKKSLTLRKKIISMLHISNVKGGGPTVGSDCFSHCLGHECEAHH
ncbi:hypothetical protein U8527_14380 [Kordia algicida OT-1]|uniref:Uncharacterized protein n=1 Tax=Kordia algicida OT-1 TaxID=391587 RepID=A9DY75_9FLAO|nr:hypothetical protein [Kordia algicida]EDP96095.1 hypothetical protein KAOT1_07998 [Kordia algicida OT-1]